MRRPLISQLAATCLLATAGCSISAWNDLESSATTVGIVSRDPFPAQTFGSVLASYRTTTSTGLTVSRLVVGSGRIDIRAGEVDSMYSAYSGWTDDHLELGSQLYVHCEGLGTGCPADAGSAIAPIADLNDRHGCVIAGAPAEPVGTDPVVVVVSCEYSDTTTIAPILKVRATALPTSRLGAAVASIPSNAPGLGVGVATAPGANELWLLGQDASMNSLPIVGAPISATAALGEAMATAAITSDDPTFLAKLPASDERALFALAAPGENRVYVTVARVVGGVPVDATVVACLDGDTSAGFGTTLTAGDITGDGIPEVVVGAHINVLGRPDTISIFSLADVDLSLGTPVGCTEPTSADDPPIYVRECTPSADASCEGFGSALALGDADGDGILDVLVGAPLASVGNTTHAGAAFLFAGNASLDVVVSDTNVPRLLVDSTPSVNDTLGLAVTFLDTQLNQSTASTDARARPRSEPVASAPGANRVFVFLCSGLAMDSASESTPRCVVQH